MTLAEGCGCFFMIIGFAIGITIIFLFKLGLLGSIISIFTASLVGWFLGVFISKLLEKK
jgi:hypothetical protein